MVLEQLFRWNGPTVRKKQRFMDTATTTQQAPAKSSQVQSPERASLRWWSMLAIGLSQLMVVLDATIMNVALPSAQLDLNFSDSLHPWVITAYALAFWRPPAPGWPHCRPGGPQADLPHRPGGLCSGLRPGRSGANLRGPAGSPCVPGNLCGIAGSGRIVAAHHHFHQYG